VRRVADDHHRALVPGRHLGQVVGGEAGVQHRPVGVDGAQGVQAVAGHRQVGADLLGGLRVGLVDDCLDTGALQRHRGHRAGDAPTDDQGLPMMVLPS
jgi:hypothetical protein